jgi:hypothetical protein
VKTATHINWDGRWRFEDSSGKMRARILSMDGTGTCRMERWTKKNPARRTRFDLPFTLLVENRTGWRFAEAEQ